MGSEKYRCPATSNCLIKRGKYVQFQVDLVEAPDTGDLTGILTVTDITEEKIRKQFCNI